jgi:predicted ABC-class ATPase
VEKVDISPFIKDLPFGKETGCFSTDEASGSTSQAANIIEALEVGAEVLLMDEDTSATNFMIRDRRMQELVSKDKEPITPFIDKVHQLYEERQVSTILVMGGAGDYFDVADTVIMMDHYEPECVTQEARRIAQEIQVGRKAEGGGSFGTVTARCPVAHSFDASKGKRDVKIRSRGVDEISFGRYDIDVSLVEQIVHPGQTRSIGELIHYLSRKHMDGHRSLAEILGDLETEIDKGGLEACLPFLSGNFARPRKHEIAAAINRLRTLRVVQQRSESASKERQ